MSLLHVKQLPGYRFRAPDLIHIFIRLTEYVLLLREQGYSHSDISPAVVRLFAVESGDRTTHPCYDVRVVNCEGLAASDSLRNSGDEQFRCEIYSVIRTLLWLAVDESTWNESFSLDSSPNRAEKLTSLTDLMRASPPSTDPEDQARCERDLELIADFIKHQALRRSQCRVSDALSLLNELK